MDRYNHDLAGDDTDETDDSPLFGSFSSYSPQYKRQYSSRLAMNISDHSSSTGDDIGKVITTPELRKLDVTKIDNQLLHMYITLTNSN